MDVLCDFVVGVLLNQEKRLARIVERDNIDESKAKMRFSNQHDDAYYKEKCDFCVNGDDKIDDISVKLYDTIMSMMRNE